MRSTPQRNRRRNLALALLPGLLLFARCGTNTDTPVYPIISTLSPPGTPAIYTLTPVVVTDSYSNYDIQFDLSYYITSDEPEFVGYNLYITTTSQSPDSVSVQGPYLPLGYSPSFPHPDAPYDTSSSSLITQRVTHFKPPPSEVPFYQCEIYYFRMTSLMNTGIESQPGPVVSACAAVDITLCPKGTPCNP